MFCIAVILNITIGIWIYMRINFFIKWTLLMKTRFLRLPSSPFMTTRRNIKARRLRIHIIVTVDRRLKNSLIFLYYQCEWSGYYFWKCKFLRFKYFSVFFPFSDFFWIVFRLLNLFSVFVFHFLNVFMNCGKSNPVGARKLCSISPQESYRNPSIHYT